MQYPKRNEAGRGENWLKMLTKEQLRRLDDLVKKKLRAELLRKRADLLRERLDKGSKAGNKADKKFKNSPR